LIHSTASQTINIANISLRGMYPLPFPLPSLAEQHRIVARVEQLWGLCDTLEAKLQAAQVEREKLVEAVVARVTGKTRSEDN
jgi:type I restriction enzyme, S subunit